MKNVQYSGTQQRHIILSQKLGKILFYKYVMGTFNISQIGTSVGDFFFCHFVFAQGNFSYFFHLNLAWEYLLFDGTFTWVWCSRWKLQYFLHWKFGSIFTYSKILFVLLLTSAPWFGQVRTVPGTVRTISSTECGALESQQYSIFGLNLED